MLASRSTSLHHSSMALSLHKAVSSRTQCLGHWAQRQLREDRERFGDRSGLEEFVDGKPGRIRSELENERVLRDGLARGGRDSY